MLAFRVIPEKPFLSCGNVFRHTSPFYFLIPDNDHVEEGFACC